MTFMRVSTIALSLLIPGAAFAAAPSVVLPEDLVEVVPEVIEEIVVEEIAAAIDIDVEVPEGEYEPYVYAGPPETSLRPMPRPEGLGTDPVQGLTLTLDQIPEGLAPLHPAGVFALLGDVASRGLTAASLWQDPEKMAGVFTGDFTITPVRAAPSPEFLASLAEKVRLEQEEAAWQAFLRTPEGRYTTMAQEELLTKYGTEVADEELVRVAALAQGAAEKDYAWRPEKIAAMRASNEDFRMSESSMSARREALLRLRDFIASPEGAAHLARMTPQQMIALTEMMSAIEERASVAPIDAPAVLTQAAATPHQSSQAVQATLPGIPSLSFKPESEQAPAGPVRDVGTSQNLLLAGWNVGHDAQGRVVMFLGSDVDSGIELSQGMVMGALGKIVEIRTVGEELIVRFATGDELKGKA